jgi:serine/threonine protein kinase
MPLTTGAQFDHYEILLPLGAGGMGEVWRARDLPLSREVAIKILPEEFALAPDRLQRFEREARAASHAGLSEKNAALELLQKAYDERSDRMPYLKVEPRFRRLQSDPGFTKLLIRLNLD